MSGREKIHVFNMGKKKIYVREENLQNFLNKNKPVYYDVVGNIMFFTPLGNKSLRRRKNK